MGVLRNLSVLLAVGFLTSCVAVRGAKMPDGWGPLVKMSDGCREIAGTYLDHPTEATGGVSAARWAFSFFSSAVRPAEMTLGRRVVKIYFSDDGALKLLYELDGVSVDHRRISSDGLICRSNYVELNVSDRWGDGGDHYFPDVGHFETVIRLSRTDRHLVVDTISSGEQAVAGVIPQISKNESWYRFLKVEK